MGRPEGSRIHEYAIQTTFSGLHLDGWRTVRIRNYNVPLIAVRAGKIRVAGHAAHDWVTDIELASQGVRRDGVIAVQEDVDEYLAVGTFSDHVDLRGKDMSSFYAAVKRDLDAAATQWRAEGWHVIRQYHTNGKNGMYGCFQPDGLAIRLQEVWAIEATAESPIKRIARYGMFDGVIVAHYKAGQVFSPTRPPAIARRFYVRGVAVA